jgi:hypothetical protein
MAQTSWLDLANTSELTWTRPAYSAAHAFGAGFSPLGDPLLDTDSARARFCTDLRFAWLHADNTPAGGAEGTGLLRAEIRVFWRRGGEPSTAAINANICDPGTTPPATLSDPTLSRDFHFVYLTTAIGQVGTAI